MTQQSNEQIIKTAAEIIGFKRVRGDHRFPDDMKNKHTEELFSNEDFDLWYHPDPNIYSLHVFPQPDGSDHWDVLTNANHTNMLIDALMDKYPIMISTSIEKHKRVIHIDWQLGRIARETCNDKKDWLKTITLAAIDAVRALKEKTQ
jgi:hypothetical protein